MVRLKHTTAGHNKFYEFDLVRTNGHVKVLGYYGAIGQAPKETIIYHGESEAEARKELDRKQNEKLRKGYVPVNGNGTPVPTPQPKQSTNGSLPTIWPMAAQGIEDDTHLDMLMSEDSFIAQEKLDGMRAIVHVTKDGLRIFSRSAGVDDPTRPLEKTSALPHLATLKFPKLVGTILDCEILVPGTDCATLSGSVNSKNGNGAGNIVAYVFDLIRLCGEDYTERKLKDRLASLYSISPQFNSPFITLLPWADNTASKKRLLSDVLKRGGEGIMLKNLNAQYVCNARPVNNWFKVKRSATYDCVVIGFTKGAGKYNNRIGALRFGQFVSGTLTELGQASGMTDAIRTHMSLHQSEYIGKVVTIKGQERLRSGAIRHPQFVSLRFDKQARECVYNPNEQ